MKITTIKEIKNIGKYVNFEKGSSKRFDENLMFIFGLNTYGKTTLTDIFQSVKYNNPVFIENRKTIPNNGEGQKVVFGVKDGSGEKDVKFINGKWENNIISENLEIFSSDFIQKNLYLGFGNKKETEENFTNFILGEEGFKQIEEIENEKKVLKERKTNIKNLYPVFLKGRENDSKFVGDFIKFNIEGLDLKELKNKLLENKNLLKQENEKLENPNKILSLQNPSIISIDVTSCIDNLNDINNLLCKNFKDFQDDFLQKFQEHIKNNFKNEDFAENWIKQGLDNLKCNNGNCIFCGQDLKNSDLMGIYNAYFDEKYIEFIDEIINEIDNNFLSFKNQKFQYLLKFQGEFNKVNKFKDYIKDESFIKNLDDFEKNFKNLGENELGEEKERILNLLEEKILQKNKKPYKNIDGIDFGDFQMKLEKYFQNAKQMNLILGILEENIVKFKNSISTENILKNTKKIKEKIFDLEYKIARIEQDKDCENCKKEKQEIEKRINDLKEKEQKLEEEQTIFLNLYFDDINRFFKKFGSHNFRLEKIINRKGNKLTYQLKIYFKEEEINDDRILTIFSESDRRALALSVFFAKLLSKKNDELEKTIIVLDDPITSFDNERMRIFSLFLKNDIKVSQVIILTHFEEFLKNYAKFTQTTKSIKSLKILQAGELDVFDCEKLFMTDYEISRNIIQDFIDGKIEEIDFRIMRNFLENEYPVIFKGIIDEEIIEKCKNKFHFENHNNSYSERDIEDFRNLCKDVWKELYPFIRYN